MTPRATIDLETRSQIDLKKVGTWRYSIDPTTEVLVLGYRLPYWEEGRVEYWEPSMGRVVGYVVGSLSELVDWITDSNNLVEAHNAWFERCIWQNLLVGRYGFPTIRGSQWTCSAAKAAALALPRSLEKAALALGLSVVKDLAGHKVMLKMSKPRKFLKDERLLWDTSNPGQPYPVVYHESEVLRQKLFAYNRQDVLAEEALSKALPDLSPDEQRVYELDQTMNERGFQLDQEAVQTALRLLSRETRTLNTELADITQGTVSRASERGKLLAWFQAQGLTIEDTTKETVNNLLGNGPDSVSKSTVGETRRPFEILAPESRGRFSPEVERSLQILQAVGQSSTAKYQKMAAHADARDWRIRGGLLYHGATTGRWSGSGIQPHNFPKGSVGDIETLWDALKSSPTGRLLDKNGHQLSVMSGLAQGLRGAIVARSGYKLFVADYNAIEARVLAWLADDQELLNDFRQGVDPYLKMASRIYGYECNKKDHIAERALGKVAILGLGYQMGAAKFLDSAWTLGKVRIDDTLAQKTVDIYREARWKIKRLWWDTQDAAIQAVHGPPVSVGRITYLRDGRFLYCVLPSGRRLAYPDPEVSLRMTPWGEKRPAMTFMGVDTRTHKWTRQVTYGGLLVENYVQAVARDFMAYAMLSLEDEQIYLPVLSVHDEVIAEGDPEGDIDDYIEQLTRVPAWGEGCPIVAEGWKGNRYRK